MTEAMYKTHPYTQRGVCPCRIGDDAVCAAVELFHASHSVAEFTDEMERRRVIGRRLWYSEKEHALFIVKQYARDCGGGCAGNDSRIGERCHCDHYNHSTETAPKHYCRCGAEFYRPMFAPLFGADVALEPYNTVLSGDDECVIAVRVGKTGG